MRDIDDSERARPNRPRDIEETGLERVGNNIPEMSLDLSMRKEAEMGQKR